MRSRLKILFRLDDGRPVPMRSLQAGCGPPSGIGKEKPMKRWQALTHDVVTRWDFFSGGGGLGPWRSKVSAIERTK